MLCMLLNSLFYKNTHFKDLIKTYLYFSKEDVCHLNNNFFGTRFETRTPKGT